MKRTSLLLTATLLASTATPVLAGNSGAILGGAIGGAAGAAIGQNMGGRDGAVFGAAIGGAAGAAIGSSDHDRGYYGRERVYVRDDRYRYRDYDDRRYVRYRYVEEDYRRPDRYCEHGRGHDHGRHNGWSRH